MPATSRGRPRVSARAPSRLSVDVPPVRRCAGRRGRVARSTSRPATLGEVLDHLVAAAPGLARGAAALLLPRGRDRRARQRPRSASSRRARGSTCCPPSPAARSRRDARRGGQPPMADMGRVGWTKLGSSIPCPGSLSSTTRRRRRSISARRASVVERASSRSAVRRSSSSRANRQLRSWPSAVRRSRSHDAQNGSRHARDDPDRGGPAVDDELLGRRGSAPRHRGEREVLGERREDLVGGDHRRAQPHAAGVERHLLDEAQAPALVERVAQQGRAPRRR